MASELTAERKQPRTQADLDALTAADVAELTDADLAAAFARLVGRDELLVSQFGDLTTWELRRLHVEPFAEYGFTLKTVNAIRKRGFVVEFFSTEDDYLAEIKSLDPNRWNAYRHDDPARALLTAAVLAAITERDAG